jgi:hypothetical protein
MQPQTKQHRATDRPTEAGKHASQTRHCQLTTQKHIPEAAVSDVLHKTTAASYYTQRPASQPMSYLPSRSNSATRTKPDRFDYSSKATTPVVVTTPRKCTSEPARQPPERTALDKRNAHPYSRKSKDPQLSGLQKPAKNDQAHDTLTS